ncbi:MAG TPA: PQQ-binding-like beta-propeller repeat protein [Ktedonobacterales bacterium]|nr:PQQ-binding-like beta-propeller repeat protein [Ktedonobacterales bacterium]
MTDPTPAPPATLTLHTGDPSLCTPGSNLAPLPATYATLYAITSNGVVALNASDGSQRWRWTDNSHTLTDYVTADASNVYANAFQPGGGTAHITALGAADGVVRWQLQLVNALGASSTEAKLVVSDGVVYAAVTDGTLRALDGATGASRWTAQIGVMGSYPALTLSSGVIFASYAHDDYATNPTTLESYHVAVRAGDGTVLWQAQTKSHSSVLGAANGFMYTADSPPVPSTLTAFNAATGDVRWHVVVGTGGVEVLVAAGTGIYYDVNSGDGLVSTYALNASNGALCWARLVQGNAPPGEISSPVLDGKLMYDKAVCADPGPTDFGKGCLYAVDARTGENRWLIQDKGAFFARITPDSLVNNVIYLNAIPAVALRADSGAIIWSDSAPSMPISIGPTSSALQVVGTTVYVAYPDGSVRALNAADGTVRWNVTLGGPITHLVAGA